MTSKLPLLLSVALLSSACERRLCGEVNDLEGAPRVLAVGDSVLAWAARRCHSRPATGGDDGRRVVAIAQEDAPIMRHGAPAGAVIACRTAADPRGRGGAYPPSGRGRTRQIRGRSPMTDPRARATMDA